MGNNVAEVKEEQQKVTKVKKERSGGVWFGLVILLIIIGVAGAGYLLLQQLRDKQQDLGGELSKDSQQMLELTKQISGYQSQLVAIQTQLAGLSSDVSNKEDNFEHRLNSAMNVQEERLDNTVKGIKGSIQRIHRQLGKTRGDWLVSDAEYLLSVANRRLHLMGDVGTTLEALKAADQRLRESGDTAAFKIRGQIAKEISSVQQINVADLVGIYSALKVLEDQVLQLNLLLPYSGKANDDRAAQNQKQKSDKADVNNVLDEALFEIEGIISVRRLDAPVKAIITPEHKAFIQEQMSSKLVLVKLALLQRDDALYQLSLEDVSYWLAKNFTNNSVRVQFENELAKLKAIQIQTNFPDISQSFKMLKDIVKLRLETDKAMSNDTNQSNR